MPYNKRRVPCGHTHMTVLCLVYGVHGIHAYLSVMPLVTVDGMTQDKKKIKSNPKKNRRAGDMVHKGGDPGADRQGSSKNERNDSMRSPTFRGSLGPGLLLI